jgi:hypothetical protein
MVAPMAEIKEVIGRVLKGDTSHFPVSIMVKPQRDKPNEKKDGYQRVDIIHSCTFTGTAQDAATSPVALPTQEKAPATHHLWKGLTFSVLSAICLSISSVLVKIGAPTIPIFLIIMARGLGPMVFSAMGCAIKGISPVGDRQYRFWMCVRGLTGSTALTIFYFAVTLLPISDATGKLPSVYSQPRNSDHLFKQ